MGCNCFRRKHSHVEVSDFVATLNWLCNITLGNSYAFSAKTVTKTLEKRGISNKKSSVMYYIGVSIKHDIYAEYKDYLEKPKAKKEEKE